MGLFLLFIGHVVVIARLANLLLSLGRNYWIVVVVVVGIVGGLFDQRLFPILDRQFRVANFRLVAWKLPVRFPPVDSYINRLTESFDSTFWLAISGLDLISSPAANGGIPQDQLFIFTFPLLPLNHHILSPPPIPSHFSFRFLYRGPSLGKFILSISF